MLININIKIREFLFIQKCINTVVVIRGDKNDWISLEKTAPEQAAVKFKYKT